MALKKAASSAGRTGDFKKTGWKASEALMENFVLVTEENKKEVVVTGRIFYSFVFSIYCGFFDYCPRIFIGRLHVKNHELMPDHSVWITTSETVEQFKERFKPLSALMANKQLYYRPSDGLAKFTQTNR